MNLNWTAGFLVLYFAVSSHCTMLCELKNAQLRIDYKISETAAAGIIFDNGTTASSMQVFQCTCSTNNDIFDDQDITNFDKSFYKAGVMDWVQSQVLRIYNCSTLTLSLKNGKNTISDLLRGKMLIIDDVTNLILTGFNVGLPYTSKDDTFSSIYFRNVTFYQIPPYLEFSDRFEVLFSQVKTNEGSSKVEPFEIRMRNTNFSRNSIFRIEYSRFGGVNLVADGYSHDVFILKVENSQMYNNTECYKDYMGVTQLVGNFFGYLRDKNINVTGGQEVLMEDNFVDTLYGTPVYLANLKQTKIRSNMFGFQLLEPALSVAYFRGATGSRSCSTYDLPESAVTLVDLSGNQVRKLTSSSFVKLDIDPNYSLNFVDKISILDTRVMLPCNCTQVNSTSSYPTDSEKLGLKAIKDSHCIPWRMGLHLMPPQMGKRTDICNGGTGSFLSQQYSTAAEQTGSGSGSTWLSNNPYFQGSKSNGFKQKLQNTLLGVSTFVIIFNSLLLII